MSDTSEAFLQNLVSDLKPVAPLRPRSGMAWALSGLALGTVLILSTLGLRRDFASGHPQPLVLIAAGLFLVLALASAWAAADMARPAVGTRREGWIWTVLMVTVLPGSALAIMAMNAFASKAAGLDLAGYSCLVLGCAVGLLTAVALTLWLRRGAPSSPSRAGLLIGVAAGAAGIFAVSLWCPSDSLLHIGIWHGLTVVVMGLLGRVVLSRALYW